MDDEFISARPKIWDLGSLVQEPAFVKRARMWPEPNVVLISEIIRDWDGRREADLGIVGVPFDQGVANDRRGARYGPKFLRETIYGSSTFLLDQDIDISSLRIVDCGDINIDPCGMIHDFNESHRRIETAMTEIFQKNMIPIVLGGDHSITYPCIKALHNSMPEKKIGIIDFDSHHDMRSGIERHSGLWVRQAQEIARRPVEGKNIVQVGIHGHGYSQLYSDTVKKMGILVFKPSDVRRMGIEAVMKQAFERASDGTDCIYLSLDIDVLDQTFVPASQAEPGGMLPWDLFSAMAIAGKDRMVRAFDVVEIAPPLDTPNQLTTKMGAEAVLQFLGGVAHRKRAAST